MLRLLVLGCLALVPPACEAAAIAGPPEDEPPAGEPALPNPEGPDAGGEPELPEPGTEPGPPPGPDPELPPEPGTDPDAPTDPGPPPDPDPETPDPGLPPEPGTDPEPPDAGGEPELPEPGTEPEPPPGPDPETPDPGLPPDPGTDPELPPEPPPAPASPSCAEPAPEWIWCDDFEEDRLDAYFEYGSAGGGFTREPGAGFDGSTGMRARFAPGQTAAGSLHLAFGRTPDPYIAPVDDGTARYREVHWRIRLRLEPGWVGGGGDKLARATVFASPGWAQAMIAHVWSGKGANANRLVIDPARGTDAAGVLQTTGYNDFDRLAWLGAAPSGSAPFGAGRVGVWQCIEVRVRLNDPGQANGVFELRVDGVSEARREGLNFLGAYDAYGINAIFLENHWDDGAPAAQARAFDDFVVSTAPIGC